MLSSTMRGSSSSAVGLRSLTLAGTIGSSSSACSYASSSSHQLPGRPSTSDPRGGSQRSHSRQDPKGKASVRVTSLNRLRTLSQTSDARPSRRTLSRTSSRPNAQPVGDLPSTSSTLTVEVDPDALYMDGTNLRPPPFVPSPTDPSLDFIRDRIASAQAELDAVSTEPTEATSAGPTRIGASYTAAQAASSLSELGQRLDELIDSAGGDLVLAQERLEILGWELGREKDLGANTYPNGKRKPSFVPPAELNRSDVVEMMDTWEYYLERALILALNPKSSRMSQTARDCFTHLFHGDYVFSPRRVAALITRTAMTKVIQRTTGVVEKVEPVSNKKDKEAQLRWQTSEQQVDTYFRLHHPDRAEDARKDDTMDEYDRRIAERHVKKAACLFDIKTRELAEAFGHQLELEYLYAIGLLETEVNSGIVLGTQVRKGVLASAHERADQRAEVEKHTADAPKALGWSYEDKLHVGSTMVALALDVWNLRPLGPSFHGTPAFKFLLEESHTGTISHKSAKVVRPDAQLVKLLVNAAPDVRFMARDLPMIAPPRLWPTKKNGLNPSQSGGYYTRKTGIVKKMDRLERRAGIEQAMASGQMDQVLEAVNTISSNKWRVNSAVLDVIIRAIDPDRPFFKQAVKYRDPRSTDPLDRIAACVKPHHLLPLNIARAFAGRDFYLPHNLDYRGRIYSLSPYLHPPGDDFSRGLLTFGETRPLGPDGLYWLKVHLSGVYGKDKDSFDGRVAWVDSKLDEIRASAREPTTAMFWLSGDKPFQILAACFEIENALSSADVEAYESSLPVHMDGTCNGMQYYAALGRDLKGGASVNLSPAEVPQDVYGEVLTDVKEQIDQSNNDSWEILKEHEHALLGRKTVKPTVMTSVYGVTDVGAKAQVKEALTAANETIGRSDAGAKKLTDAELDKLSKQLADTILASINRLFPVATSIQEWLGTCLQLIVEDVGLDATTNFGKSMAWTTPLGLPVVQAYRAIATKTIKTALQRFTILDHSKEQLQPVQQFRERNGFAPNFIHSLDASHLFMTVNDCTSKGVTFGSVHDSFWTHAATVPVLNASLRDAFVRLHETDTKPHILETLRQQLIETFGQDQISRRRVEAVREHWAATLKQRHAAGVKDEESAWVRWAHEKLPEDVASVRIMDVLPPRPQLGQLDINDVKKSAYFFK